MRSLKNTTILGDLRFLVTIWKLRKQNLEMLRSSCKMLSAMGRIECEVVFSLGGRFTR